VTGPRIPPPVGLGAHIRVVSPAMPSMTYIPARERRGRRALTDLGYTVTYGSHAFDVSDDGLTAGTPAQRASDLMEAFADPSVQVILAADGGVGTRDLLPLLDPAVIAANPKPFVGYSDNVYLNQYLLSEVGLSSLNGCTLMQHMGEAGGAYPETVEYFRRALASDQPLRCEPLPSRTVGFIDFYVPEREARPRTRDIPGGWTWLRPGRAEAPLIGAEVTLVPSLVAEFGLVVDGTVLYWDISFHGYDVELHFKALCERLDVTRLAGMVIGSHPGIAPPAWAETVDQMLDAYLPDATYPVVVNTDLSHTSPSWTVPYGETVVLSSPDDLMVFPRLTIVPR
jgi:muramoyltetrapeptide carboxypeptidase LdcA involved in peptidoglycan recycling